MGVLSSKYPNVQAVEDALNKACESVSNTEFNNFKSTVYTKSDTEAYTTEEKNKLSGISEGANKTVIDTTLSSISTNPVQNKVIKTSLDSKANSSDVYTKTESDSRFLNIDGTAKKAVSDENGKNISESFATDKNDISLNRTTLGTQCKNLLKHSATTQTINGVTFTVNDDKSITVNGTATANAVFKFATLTLQAGTYKYSGISIPASSSTANMSVFRTSDWVGLCALTEKDTFTTPADTKIECRAVIYNGYTADNVVFYPMLRCADITDSNYEPYKPSLQEQITALEERISVLEGGV